MELPQGKHPAITHPFELLYNNTTLPRFPYYTNQPPYLLQTYTKYNNHHPHSSLPHQEPNPHPENHSTLHSLLREKKYTIQATYTIGIKENHTRSKT